MPEIGKRIKARREELGMTQEELAARLGYKSKTTIAKIENGTNDIVQSKVMEFAKMLDTTPAYLMGWEQIDPYFSGKEAPDEIYQKFAKNILRFHGKQKELNEIYNQLSSRNQDKVLTYSKSLLTKQQLDDEVYEVAAAHDRTDLEITAEGRQHDLDLMNDDSKWEE